MTFSTNTHTFSSHSPSRTHGGGRLAGLIRARITEALARRRLNAALGMQSVAALRDIGLTGDDVASVCHQPLGNSASAALTRIAVAHVGNW